MDINPTCVWCRKAIHQSIRRYLKRGENNVDKNSKIDKHCHTSASMMVLNRYNRSLGSKSSCHYTLEGNKFHYGK
jgi:hypothetical protein